MKVERAREREKDNVERKENKTENETKLSYFRIRRLNQTQV